jgi:hypothetical protein
VKRNSHGLIWGNRLPLKLVSIIGLSHDFNPWPPKYEAVVQPYIQQHTAQALISRCINCRTTAVNTPQTPWLPLCDQALRSSLHIPKTRQAIQTSKLYSNVYSCCRSPSKFFLSLFPLYSTRRDLRYHSAHVLIWLHVPLNTFKPLTKFWETWHEHNTNRINSTTDF